MDNQDVLRIQMSKAAEEENRRMREVCRIRTRDPWANSRYGKKNGAKGGRPQHIRPYRDHFLNRIKDAN